MVIIESAGITDRGRIRKGNEDDLFLDNGLGLYIVADGMGGHQAGEIASKLVVETISKYVKKSKENGDSKEAVDYEETLSKEASRLLAGIQMSNKAVYDASLGSNSYRGMGSTVSAVYSTDATLVAANVGDSPIYLVRDGKIKLLSVPHTLVAEQAAHSPEYAEKLGKKFRHVLTRAMGTEKTVKADLHEIQCFKDDILVISSDGLSDKASPEEILDLVNNNRLDTACRKLVELANDRGGEDNITAIVLRVMMVKNTRKKFKRLMAQVKRNFSRIFKKI